MGKCGRKQAVEVDNKDMRVYINMYVRYMRKLSNNKKQNKKCIKGKCNKNNM